MLQAKEVCRIAGITRRTLHFYNERGIVCPSKKTEAGYGLYSDADLERLFAIRLYAAMGFSLEKAAEYVDTDAEPTRDEFDAEIKRLSAEIEQKQKVLSCLKLTKMTGRYFMPEIERDDTFDTWIDKMLEANGGVLAFVEEGLKGDNAEAMNKRLLNSLSAIAAMRRKGYAPDSPEVMNLVNKSRMIADEFVTLFKTAENDLPPNAGLLGLSFLGLTITDRDSDLGHVYKPEAASFIQKAISHYCELNNGGYLENDEGELVARSESSEQIDE